MQKKNNVQLDKPVLIKISNEYLKNSSDGVRGDEVCELFVKFDMNCFPIEMPSQQSAVFHELSQLRHGSSVVKLESIKYIAQVMMTM